MENFVHKRIFEEIQRARKIVLVSDKGVDGDSLGASLAMLDYLKSIGKDAPVYVARDIPLQYRWMPHIDACTRDESVVSDPEVDLIITFDCSNEKFVRELVPDKHGALLINIDHHKTNPLYGDVNQVVVEASATAQIIADFYKVNRLTPSRHAATCILAGIAFDTGVLTNDATNERAFAITSEMVLLGGNIKQVIQQLYRNRSVPALKIWGIVLERLVHDEERDFVATCLTKEDLAMHEITEGEVYELRNYLNFVVNADTIFVMTETDDGGVKVSLRSRARDISLLAKYYGGGGHAKSAGFYLPNARIDVKSSSDWKVVPLS